MATVRLNPALNHAGLGPGSDVGPARCAPTRTGPFVQVIEPCGSSVTDRGYRLAFVTMSAASPCRV
jgi:hypothetical protein